MTATHTITIEYRGIRFAVKVAYDVDDPIRAEYLSIKPDGDDADFLDFFLAGPEWPAVDRAIDRAWNEWVTVYESCGYDDVMDAARAERENKES